ncbi:hypothetical protein [Butyrivibrio sp. MC2013]|uniref:hypothetical protein n=1 Tax=Butyrivibrio sp. MC2013 TaxID=1280686 RepID=UPI000419F017|nr:hypothetical protein [Butyrivibrio sp. MC2013]
MKISFWLGEEDHILTSWLDAPQNKNKCRLITRAIEYYIDNHDYICIGKVNPGLHQIVTKNRSLSLGRESKAENWYAEYSKDHKRGATTKIKEILIRSIEITDTEEYYPSRYEDLRPIENGRKVHAMPRIEHIQSQDTAALREEKKKSAVRRKKGTDDFMDAAIEKMLGSGPNRTLNFG